jgi:Ni/Co efflux regulator RcnB
MRHAIKTGLSLLFALAFAAAPAIARDHDRGHGRGHGNSGHQYDGRDHGRSDYRRGDRDHYRKDDRRYGYRDHDYRYDRHYDRRYYRPAPRVVYRPVYVAPRWVRGGRYYDRGYGPTYVVNDYYGYGLRAPPRGYYWRRSDAGDFLLVALATGIIADLVLNH